MTERGLISLAIGLLGVSAVLTQLVLMRELLSAFLGNELVLGATLAAWLFMTGLGAWLGRASRGTVSPVRAFCLGQVLIAVLPLLQVFGVRVCRDVVFLRGADVGFAAAALSSLVVLSPYCVVSGFMLTRACSLADDRAAGVDALGRVYVADSLGSIAGGLLFSFVLVHLLEHFSLLAIPAALNLLGAVWVARRFRLKWAGRLAVAVGLGMGCLLALTRLDAVTTAWQYPGQTVLFRGHSPYGRLVVTEQDNQLNFIENGLPIISSHQVEWAEETVHYGLAQRASANRVLLVGGGFSGAVGEILKYNPREVTCIELDRLITETARRFLPAAVADPRITVVTADGRLFIKQTTQAFDAVLVSVPDPSTSLLNRYYTVEFLREVKRVLAPGGVLGFGLAHYENFVSPNLAQLLATAYQTAASVFSNVIMIPGGRVFFVASDAPLSTDVAGQLEARRIPTKLVNRHYLEAMLTPDRLADLRHAVETPARLNTDFNPVLYFHHLRRWMSQFETKPTLALGVLAALSVVFLIRLRPPAFAVFASGFAASALEVTLLLGFQALHGALYQQLGLVVTVFMTGLAVGAFGASRMVAGKAPRHKLAVVAFGLAGLAALLPACLRGLSQWDGARLSPLFVPAAILLLTFLVAVLVGLEFPLAGRAEGEKPGDAAARIYTADFVGASLGALLASAWLVPVLGTAWTCWLVALLNLLGGGCLLLRK